MPGCVLHSTCISSRISSLAHHKKHTNVFVVYLLQHTIKNIQTSLLFIFLCRNFSSTKSTSTYVFLSDKPRLYQLKVITATRAVVVQASRNLFIVTRKEKYPVLRSLSDFSSILKFLTSQCHLHSANYVHHLPKLSKPKYLKAETLQCASKSTSRISLMPFVGNPHFIIVVCRVRFLKKLFVPRRQPVSIFRGRFKIYKQPFSSTFFNFSFCSTCKSFLGNTNFTSNSCRSKNLFLTLNSSR